MFARDSFMMNGVFWRVRFVNPRSRMLIDRTGGLRLATTDPVSHSVYLSNELAGEGLVRVSLHELGHCAIISYGLDRYIKAVVDPEDWIDAEEWICNFIADYGREIFMVAGDILEVPREMDRLLA